MKSPTILPLVNALLILCITPFISAAGTLGFALGTKLPSGACKSTSDYEADFDAILSASGSKLIRGYSASDCNSAQQILPAAKAKGFQVVLGVWPDVPTSFMADTAALQTSIPGYADQVYAITVGSEALYRGSLTAQALLNSINQVKAMFPNVLVGTADSWNKFADGTADPLILGNVRLFLANAFAYWQAVNISNAPQTYFSDISQAFTHIQTLAGSGSSVQLWTGETGWPTDGGTNYGSAIASTSNAQTFFQTGVCGALQQGLNVFYFEAFDETWKPVSIGDDGQVEDETHWGAMTASRAAKFPLTC